jgi:hypothetical protein
MAQEHFTTTNREFYKEELKKMWPSFTGGGYGQRHPICKGTSELS